MPPGKGGEPGSARWPPGTWVTCPLRSSGQLGTVRAPWFPSRPWQPLRCAGRQGGPRRRARSIHATPWGSRVRRIAALVLVVSLGASLCACTSDEPKAKGSATYSDSDAPGSNPSSAEQAGLIPVEDWAKQQDGY